MNKKILVAAPIYSGMKYCFKQFIEAVKNIDYQNYDILLIDNSRDKELFKELKKDKKIKVIYDTTNERRNLFRLISSRNKIINYARKSEYDYLLMLDADVIIPKNIIKELLKFKKDIISGLYLQYSGNKLIANAHIDIGDDKLRSLNNEEINSDKIFKVRMASNGCMLLNKKAISELEYGYLGYGLDDNYFFEKAMEKGFDVYCYPKVLCDHILGKDKFIEGKHHLD